MQKHVGKIGAIYRELHGKACPFCGGEKYQLVLRGDLAPKSGALLARCSRCHRLKELDEDFGRILWM